MCISPNDGREANRGKQKLCHRLNIIHDDVIHSSSIDLVNVNRKTDGRARLPVNKDVGEHGRAGNIKPVGIKKPRAIATAFMAWLTAPAPTHWMLTGTPSLTMPAMAPATDAGDDLLDTFRQSMKKLLRLKVRFNCNNCIVPSGLGKGTIPLWQDRRSQ